MNEWAQLTNDEVDALDRALPVILPLGLIEAHGPHLATSVDADTASYFARRIAERTGAILLPTVNFGFADEMRAYPGTLGVSLETMAAVVGDLAGLLCEHGFKRQVWLSGHGANKTPAELALHRVWERHPDLQACYWNYWSECGLNHIRHADKGETEIAAAVGTRHLPERAKDWRVEKPWYRIRSRRDIHQDSGGINGEPSRAEPAEGERMRDFVVDTLSARVAEIMRA
ncbi:MAG: creatininase family protein [Verrucomicrobiota bacterium]